MIYPRTPPGMVGVPGHEQFTVTVKDDAGLQHRARFRAVYARPWVFSGFGETFEENAVLE